MKALATPGSRSGLAAVLLVLLIGLAFAPVFRGGFIWDDDAHVTENPALRSGQGLLDIWIRPGATPQYYPLTFTSFWIERRLWGDQPAGYHAVNVVLHALNALLVWRLLRRLGAPGAWLAAALFALHPVQVETVAWVSERKNLLSTLFVLLALREWIKILTLPVGRAGYTRLLFWYLGALLSKTTAAMLPPAALLIAWWKNGRVTRRDLAALLPMAAIGLLFGLVTLWMEHTHIGARGPEWNLTPVQRILVAGRAFWFYLQKLAWPTELLFMYPRWNPARFEWTAWGYPAGFAALAALLWLGRAGLPELGKGLPELGKGLPELGKGLPGLGQGLPERRPGPARARPGPARARPGPARARPGLGRAPLAGLLLFAVLLFPALGFFNVYPQRYSYVADHFQYLACVVPLGFAAAALARLAARPRFLLPGLSALLLGVLGTQTHARARVFQEAESVWQDTLAGNPDCWAAHAHLGLIALARGDLAGARQRYGLALSIQPDAVEVLVNLGNLAMRQDHLLQAESWYTHALEINPGFPMAHFALGRLRLIQQQYPEARRHLEQAGRLRSLRPYAEFQLGNLAVAENRFEEAAGHYRAALRDKPDHPQAHNNLGICLVKLEEPDEALAAFHLALRYDPGMVEAMLNAARVLAGQSRYDEAAEACRQALARQPGNMKSHLLLIDTLATAGAWGEALAATERALQVARMQPDAAPSVDLAQLREALRERAESAGAAP
jgi:tetratricopeptide (TPR) repeat protein